MLVRILAESPPGKRDFITVNIENNKMRLQKRDMCMSIKETHGMFKEENPEVKIGLTKFAELQPPNVLLGSQTPSNVCTCIYHDNMILALSAVNKHVLAFHHIPRISQHHVWLIQRVIYASLENIFTMDEALKQGTSYPRCWI